jgi:hypothetical protein
MTQIDIALESGHHCPCFGLYEKKLVSNKYDFGLWRSLSKDIEELNDVDLRAIQGRQIVSKLPNRFRRENNGRFIAVTYTNKVLVVCDTLEALNKEIAKKNPKENYYIERLGYSTIAQI